jgi:hypothetical protein
VDRAVLAAGGDESGQLTNQAAFGTALRNVTA